MSKQQQADFDSPWKDAIERFFPQFMQFYFPAAHAQIDWEKGFEFLDKELQEIRPKSAIRRRTVDKLVKVYLKAGGDAWILVHVEVQSQREAKFPERLYQYNYRSFDKHHRPVASFGVLADKNPRWRPGQFRQEVLGCEVSLRFPTVKLLDCRDRWEELEESDNPFAVITMAYLRTLETAKDMRKRLSHKLWIARRLRRIGLSQEERWQLFRLVDWFMDLPEVLQLEFDEQIVEEGEKMPFVTGIERRAEERGEQRGYQKGEQSGEQRGYQKGEQRGSQKALALLLSRQLVRKFGPLSEEDRKRVASADSETLMEWGDRVVTAERINDVFN